MEVDCINIDEIGGGGYCMKLVEVDIVLNWWRWILY